MFGRIGRFIRGFFSLFFSGIEARNPQVLMEAARQEFRTKMANYNTALAKIAGIAERLKVQVKTKTQKIAELDSRIMANHRAGNVAVAASLAKQRQELVIDLEHDKAEMEETDGAYQANLRQLKVTQKEFEDKIKGLEKKLSETQIKEAQAEAGAALSNVAFNVNDMGDTLKTVDEALDKRYQDAAGKARLVKDSVNMEQVQLKETEQAALEQDALAQFLAEKGIGTPAPTTQVVVQEPVKQMGAAQ